MLIRFLKQHANEIDYVFANAKIKMIFYALVLFLKLNIFTNEPFYIVT